MSHPILKFQPITTINGKNNFIPVYDATEDEVSNQNKKLEIDRTLLKGDTGDKGIKGNIGVSAFNKWLNYPNNANKSITDYFKSLSGDKGDAGENGNNGEVGKSLYQIAVQNGFKGSEKDLFKSFVIKK